MTEAKNPIIYFHCSSVKWFLVFSLVALIVIFSYQHHIGPLWNREKLRITKDDCDPSVTRCTSLQQRTLQSVQDVLFPEPRQRPDLVPPIPSHPDRLFYNRVPKCGSHTFLDVIHIMASSNNFTFERAPEYMRFHVETYYQLKFVDRLKKINPPMMYERHIHFVDFSKFGQPQPVYINLIRDPLERMVSWYYFRRFQEGHVRELPDEIRNRSFDACVRGNFTECTDMHGDDPEQGYFKIIPFFCGQEEYCRHDGERALRTAILNVDKHYLVVGVTEQFPDFVGALENMLPSYFRGGNKYFRREGPALKAKHKTVKKQYPSDDVVRIMTDKMKNEYKFYKYVRQKFNGLLYGLSLREALKRSDKLDKIKISTSKDKSLKT